MIRTIIESNPLTQHLKQDLTQWQVQNFTVDRDVISLNPSVAVTSLAASYTGLHADLIIGDDLEVSDNSITKDARNRIKERVSEFSKMAPNILLCGTPHSSESLYDHLVAIGYHIHKIPVYNAETEQLAWPDHPEGQFSWEWLEQERASTTEGDFKSQYMLIPSKTYEPLIELDKIKFYKEDIRVHHLAQPFGGYLPVVKLGEKETAPDIRRMAGAWDPATGLHGRDSSVFAVTMRDDQGNVYVHDVIELNAVDKENKDFTGQIRQIVNACTKYGIGTVFIEENFSASLINEARRVCTEMKRKIQFVNKFRSQNKKVFIAQTLEPTIKIGRLYVHNRVLNSNFMTELEEFPHNAHDDCIDAVSEAISHLPEPMVDITRIPSIQSTIRNAGNVAKISRLD
jgi:predicted phage terminase large subunit-like protein